MEPRIERTQCRRMPSTRLLLLFAATMSCGHRSSSNNTDGPGGDGSSPDAPAVDAPPAPGPGAIPVWVEPSLSLVQATASPTSTTEIELWAARGEAESLQIVVQGPATNVTIDAPDLIGVGFPGMIPKSQLTLYREYYVHTGGSPNWGGTNQPLGAGSYPEGLIPFVDPTTGAPLHGALQAEPFDLAAGTAQPYWVDVTVPRDQTPGEYYGLFTVTSDQGSSQVAVVFHVRKFTLPRKPALRSSFLALAPTLQMAEELLNDRIDLDNAPTGDERTLIDNYGYTIRGAGAWSGADVGNCTMSPAPSVASLQADAATHQPDLELYDYSADEIGSCTGLVPTLQAWGRAIHQTRMKNLVTMAPTTALMDDGSGTGRSAVDIWVVLPVMYDGAQTTIAAALAKGDAVWSYNTLVQDAYSPKWEIDWDPINFRLQPGFLSESMSLTGILYWRIDDWDSDPWNTALGFDYPGDGVMVYPGANIGSTGVAPSIRLKRLRDGVDDYDYVELLKGLGQGDWAIAQSKSIAPDWTHWTRDHAAVETLRNQLGDKIDSLTP